MKYTSDNIVGVKFTRPDCPGVIHTITKIIRYSDSSSPDIKGIRSDDDEEFIYTLKWVKERLNNGNWPVVKEEPEYEIY